ncbi:MAG TPA: hypothetical protein VMY35_17555 [Phycisphaerae bacterium]|nr:hypothetical protein [Phycisphaerae bacterium]
MSERTFVGIGFGAIQAGLFLYEAHRSGNFRRLVVAEVIPEVVAALRRDGGRYHVNIATRTDIEDHAVTGVEIFNPNVPSNREELVAAVAEAAEIATALPSVEFYDSVSPILAEGLAGKASPCVVYTAENHNHAAELLEPQVGANRRVQFLNTVVGKMSGIVTGDRSLTPVAEGLPRAFLVEEFNRILITQIRLPGFRRGITVFEEKPDLLPFEEAKLYGHNAVHALLGYLAHRRGYRFMSEVAQDPQLMTLAREAFLEESGAALIAKHAGLDPLFTRAGFQAYADDLLQRMTNPFLRDQVERVVRDPCRKLGWDDRLIGTMRLALGAGIMPRRFALGAAAALDLLFPGRGVGEVASELWPAANTDLIRLIEQARSELRASALC